MDQIGRLRIRIIGIATAVLALVIATMIAAATATDYMMISETADRLIDALQSHSWSLPANGDYDTPETPYETRYFTVDIDESDGSCIGYDMNMIGSVTVDEAEELAGKAVKSKKAGGFVGTFRYRILGRGESGGTTVAFLDRGQQLSHLRSFVAMSSVAGVMATVIVAGMTMLLSRSIIAPVKSAYRKQRSFISDAGHELRTPLAAIRADSDVAEAELGKSRWIDDIRSQVDRLSSLTDDLICLAKLEENPDAAERVDMSAVTEAGAASIEARCLSRSLELETDIDGGAFVLCDRRGAERIVSTLTDNAAKYTPAGGRISISLRTSWRTVSLTVENETSGPMGEEDVERIFERFYRLDESRSSGTGGYGMGLSIVKAVCARNGWRRTARWSPKSKTLIIRIDMPAAPRDGQRCRRADRDERNG